MMAANRMRFPAKIFSTRWVNFYKISISRCISRSIRTTTSSKTQFINKFKRVRSHYTRSKIALIFRMRSRKVSATSRISTWQLNANTEIEKPTSARRCSRCTPNGKSTWKIDIPNTTTTSKKSTTLRFNSYWIVANCLENSIYRCQRLSLMIKKLAKF